MATTSPPRPRAGMLCLLVLALGACRPASAPADRSSGAATALPGSLTPASNQVGATTAGSPPKPSAAPAAPLGRPFRLTEPGCCARPFWRADSQAMWFIDKPEGGPVGFYQAALDAPLAPATLVTTTIAALSPDQAWRITQSRDRTTLLRVADGRSYDVPAAGRSVSFSPDGRRIAWQVGGGPDNAGGGPPTDPSNSIHVANVDGSGDRSLTRLANGSLAGWLDDDQLLVRIREGGGDIDQLRTLPLDGSEGRLILSSPRLRGVSLSADRSWLAYSVSGSATAGANGLWIAGTAIDSAPPRRLDGRFGAFRWRDGQHLLIIPFEPGAASHRIIELDAASGAERPLSDPATPFRIADGDWSLSPDGRRLAFVNAADDAIWVMDLP